MPYNKLVINLACSECAEKYRISVFLYKPRPPGSVCAKKTWVYYFSVQTSRSVNKNLIICMKKLYRSKFMVTSRHETHFDGFIFDFLLPWKLVFYSHLGDVVGYVGCRSSSGGRSILGTLVGFLFPPYNNLLKMKGCSISNKIDWIFHLTCYRKHLFNILLKIGMLKFL